MFVTQPSNIDYLMDSVRLRVGDLTGTTYSNTLIRTSLLSAVRYLQTKWNSKYQIFTSTTEITPQPEIRAGYIYASTIHGDAWIKDIYSINDVYRNPFITFTQTEGIFEQLDEQVIIVAAAYIMLLAKLSNSSDTFISWSTEDIRYTNSAGAKARTDVLMQLKTELDDIIKTKIAKPLVSRMPLALF